MHTTRDHHALKPNQLDTRILVILFASFLQLLHRASNDPPSILVLPRVHPRNDVSVPRIPGPGFVNNNAARN